MMVYTFALFIIISPNVFAGNGSGSGGSGSGGGGMENPDYGDLIVILRDKDGIPIYDTTFGCLQPLDINGDLIPLLNSDCELLDESDVVEVDFGRLSLARSPEKVRQQALDEVIQAIKDCLKVSLDPAGRLALKYKIENPETGSKEVVWKTIDSPRENLALYTQLMKFGHLQTACGEIASDRGDETTYRPCLDSVVDYSKFKSIVKHVLPEDGLIDAEPLSDRDLTLASFFLAGAGDKTGVMTVDLVQYINAILDIPNPPTNASWEYPDFVDFSGFVYKRSNKFSGSVWVIQPSATDGFWEETGVELLEWLTYPDESDKDRWRNIKGFVQAANDSLQTILFLHNYEIPAPLWTYTPDTPGMSSIPPVE
jgi:hypothetical protein